MDGINATYQHCHDCLLMDPFTTTKASLIDHAIMNTKFFLLHTAFTYGPLPNKKNPVPTLALAMHVNFIYNDMFIKP